jgi:hypothetical protein
MVQAVKEFIEDNIELIDDGNWKEVFLNWYRYNNDYYFDEFIEILEHAGIDVLKESYVARARLLGDLAQMRFLYLITLYRTVTFEKIGEELSSLLGFEGQELINILDKAAVSANLIRSDKGWVKR